MHEACVAAAREATLPCAPYDEAPSPAFSPPKHVFAPSHTLRSALQSLPSRFPLHRDTLHSQSGPLPHLPSPMLLSTFVTAFPLNYRVQACSPHLASPSEQPPSKNTSFILKQPPQTLCYSAKHVQFPCRAHDSLTVS